MPFLDRVPTRLRLAVLLATAVAAGVTAVVRVASLGPQVDAYSVSDFNDGEGEYHTLRMKARGGVDLDLVRIEPQTEGVTVFGPDKFEAVPAGMRFSARVRVLYGDATQEERVRVYVDGHEDRATLVRMKRRLPPK